MLGPAVAALAAAAAAATAGAAGPPPLSLAVVDGPIVVTIVRPSGERIQVTANATDPAWSPDGRLLAYSENPTGHPRIALANGDGVPVRPLTARYPHFADYQPTWSPDARRLAFAREIPLRWRDGYLADSITELYVVRVDGTHLRRLTHDGARNTNPSWSPNGRRIAFTRNGNVDVLDLARGVELPLVRHADEAEWSPDGRRIAFVRAGGAFVATASGGRSRRVSPPNLDVNAGVAWSPDSRYLAVSAPMPNGLSGVYVLRADATGRATLRTRGSWPSWGR